jgi:hypothetical protein
LQNTIRKIIEYWQECIAPSEYEWTGWMVNELQKITGVETST